MSKDLQRDFRVLRYRLQDLNVLAGGLVCLKSGVSERQPVFLRLTVAGEQQHGTGVGGLNREQQVQQDEGFWIPVEEEDRVANHPNGYSKGLDDQEGPGPYAGGDLVGEHLAESRLVVMQDVDR